MIGIFAVVNGLLSNEDITIVKSIKGGVEQTEMMEESATNNFSEIWIYILKNLNNLSPFAGVALSVRCANRSLSSKNLRFDDENSEAHMGALNEIIDEIRKASLQGTNRSLNLESAKRTLIEIYRLSRGSAAHAVASTMRALDVTQLMLDEESRFRALYMAIQNSISACEAEALAGQAFKGTEEADSAFEAIKREWMAIYSDFKWLEEYVRGEVFVPQRFYERSLY